MGGAQQPLELIFNTLVILLVVIDPIGLAPMFAALTRGGNAQYKQRMAVKGVLLAASILLLFVFAGKRLLAALGIGLPAFRVAGGVLLFLLAIDMIFARQSGLRSTTVREQAEAEQKPDISVFPLAFPLIAGPGALTTILLMTSALRAEPWSLVIVLGVLMMVLMMTLASLLLASRIMRLLGETGANVVSRLLGLILAALAVQFVMDGVRAALGAG